MWEGVYAGVYWRTGILPVNVNVWQLRDNYPVTTPPDYHIVATTQSLSIYAIYFYNFFCYQVSHDNKVSAIHTELYTLPIFW